jgi:hypothetical protein
MMVEGKQSSPGWNYSYLRIAATVFVTLLSLKVVTSELMAMAPHTDPGARADPAPTAPVGKEVAEPYYFPSQFKAPEGEPSTPIETF